MKKIYLLLSVMLLSATAHAQFEITSTGLVNIHNPESSSAIVNVQGNTNNIRCVRKGTLFSGTNPVVEGINYATGAEMAIGVRGACFSSNGSTSCGVYGVCTQGGANKNFGVMGLLYSSSVKGAGIFGSSSLTNLTIPTFTSNYAGYFDGNVHVQGNITYSGSLTGNVILTSAPQPSAVQTGSVHSPSTRGVLTSDLLQTLDLLTYIQDPQAGNSSKSFPGAELSGLDSTESAFLRSLEDEEEQVDVIGEQVLSKEHFGLDAGQLESIFPNLVYDNEDGTKSINYVEMVPILVQAINELQSQVNELKGGQEGSVKKATGVNATVSVQVLSLGQNKPNPFSTATDIEVTVPETVQSAFLYIYDLQGKKVQQADITARGQQMVKVDAAELAEGMYLYSLIADGKVVETRRMIIE